MKIRLLFFCLSLLLVNAAITARAGSRAYIWDATNGFRDLGTLGLDSVATAVNDSGTVTGYYVPVDKFYQHGFVWTEATGMVALGIPGGGDSTTAKSYPTAINAAGHIVGYGRQVDGTQVAFYWTQTDGFTALGNYSSPADNNNTAYAINDSDQVTGNLRFSQRGGYHAYLWSPDLSAPRDLGTVNGGLTSSGYGINNSGRIVGLTFDGQGGSAFEPMNWTRQGGMTILATFANSVFAQAYAINDAGTAIGFNGTGSATQGFFKTARGQVKLLKGLGGNTVYAIAINEQGVIVGTATDTTGKTHPVMWPTPTSNPVDLITLDPLFNSASVSGINNLGQIVGDYFPQ